jgi:hypothetical protein
LWISKYSVAGKEYRKKIEKRVDNTFRGCTRGSKSRKLLCRL